MAQDGIARLEDLGYATCEGELAAFWTDVFVEVHRLDVQAQNDKKKS